MAVVTATTATNSDNWKYFIPTDLPPLTTVYERPTFCSTKWIRNHYITSEIYSDFRYVTSSDVSFYFGDLLPIDYYDGCHPYGRRSPSYSPGICPADQTMAAVLEMQYEGSRVWRGSCCDR
jgi:hypothetical protein